MSKENNNAPLDDFIIGEGFEIYNGEPPKKVKKEKVALKSILWILAIVVISVGLAFVTVIGVFDYLGIGPGRGNEIVLEIKQGSSTRQIAEQLKDTGAIKSETLFLAFSKIKGYGSQYKYGVYNFSDESGYSAIANMLINDGATADSVEVMIPEMSSVDDIIKLLVDKGVCEKADLKNAIQNVEYSYDFIKNIPVDSVYWRFEGYLFPNTYRFYCYDDSEECARLAVSKMLGEFDKQFTSEMREQAKALNRSMHEIMSLASVIELEASSASFEDKQKVAAIFYNRLNDWGAGALLQSNPTRDYPYGSGRYNTYETPGIPVGPLCSPSLDSIKAALQPATSLDGHYYFITDKFMNFYYNKTLDAHVNTQNRLIREGIYFVD